MADGRKIVSILASLVLGTFVAGTQSPPALDSPKAVVEELMRMADDGALLTPDGWKQAGTFFMHPSRRARGPYVGVISKDYSVDVLSADEQRAEVCVGFEDLGHIDASLRYIFPDTRLLKTATKYHLVRVSGHSMPQWKIEDPQGSAWTGIDAAMKYVTEMRQKAADPIVRKNADKTLEILEKLASL